MFFLYYLLPFIYSISNEIFYELCELENFLQNNVSEAALIAVPAISVAILLPLAVFLADENNINFPFDKNVVFDQVLRYKTLMVFILVDSFFLILNVRILIMLCSIGILVETGISAYRTYRWFCSNDDLGARATYKQEMRIYFLDSLKNVNKILETWNLVLFDDKFSSKNQYCLMDIYIRTYDKIPNTDYGLLRDTYLRFLLQNFEKINFSNDRVFEKLLKFSTGYYFALCPKDGRRHNEPLPFGLKEIFIKLMYVAISQNIYRDIIGYRFFEFIKEFSNNDSIDVEKFNEFFLSDFLNELEKSKVDPRLVWQYDYFNAFVVTRAKMENKETQESAISVFGAYYRFLCDKIIWSDDLEPSTVHVLEAATEHILKEIDIQFWFDMITFCNRSFGAYPDKDNYYSMVRSWCEHGRNYGLMGRTESFSIGAWKKSLDDDEVMQEINRKSAEINEKRYAETAYMVGFIKRWLWNPNECKKFLKEIKNIKNENIFKINTMEYDRLEILEWRFNQMLDFIKKENQRSRV